MKTKEELKSFFENGDRPIQEDFWNWMDSYWHKEEKILSDSVIALEKVIPLITDGVLNGHSLSITIPQDVKKISQAVFQYRGSGMKQIIEVNFNEGLEEIGIDAFSMQNIKKIKTPSTLKVIMRGAFSYQMNINNPSDSLEEIILNEGLEIIDDYAFNCMGTAVLTDLYIPGSVKSVGQRAFDIPSLQTVSAPSTLDLKNAGIPDTAKITYR